MKKGASGRPLSLSPIARANRPSAGSVACREHHGQPGLVGGLDDLIVAHGPAGLDDRRGTSGNERLQPIGKGEKRV